MRGLIYRLGVRNLPLYLFPCASSGFGWPCCCGVFALSGFPGARSAEGKPESAWNGSALPAILRISSVADGAGQGTGSNQAPPHPIHPKAKPEAQETFRKAFCELVAAAVPEGVDPGTVKIWFQDVARAGQTGVLARFRARKGVFCPFCSCSPLGM